MTSLAAQMHRDYQDRQPLPVVVSAIPLHVQMHRSYQDTGDQSLATLMHRSWEDRTLYADASTVKVDDLLLRLRRMGPSQGSQYAKQLLELLDRDPGLRRQMAAKDLAMLEAWRHRWDYAEFVEAEHPREPAGTEHGGEFASEAKVAKLTKSILGTQTLTQKRAKSGGEVGPNQEFYRGGAFIATQDIPKRIKDKIAKSATGKVQTEPGKWEIPHPGDISIFEKVAGTIFNHRDGSINHAYLEYIGANKQQVEMYETIIQKWKEGVRWVSVEEYPSLATLKDAARLLVAGRQVPADVVSKMPEEWRKHIERYRKTDYAEFNESEHPRQPAGTPEGGEFASQMHAGFTGRHDNAKAMAESAKAAPKKELLLQGGGIHKHGSEWANKFTVLLAQENRGTRKDREKTDELRMNVVSAYNKAMGNRINEIKGQIADNFGPEALDSPAWKTFLRSTGNKGTPFEHEFEAAAKAAADDAATHGSSEKAYENRFDLFDKLKEHKSKMTRLAAQHADAIDAAHRQLVKDLRGMSGGVKYAEDGDVVAAGPDMQAVAYGLAELLKLFRQPAPIVNVAPPVVNVQVEAPQVTVQPPAVTVEAPNVTFEPSPAPIINLQPNVTVEAPKEGPMRTELIFNDDGKIMGKRTIPE